jgi:large subunit ribosomal protein L10
VLLAQIAGALQAPLVKTANLLQALPRNLAYGLKALIDERGGVPAEAEAPAAQPEATDEAPTEEPAAEPEAAVEAPTEEPAAEPTDTTDAPAEEAPAAEPEVEAAPETTEE